MSIFDIYCVTYQLNDVSLFMSYSCICKFLRTALLIFPLMLRNYASEYKFYLDIQNEIIEIKRINMFGS